MDTTQPTPDAGTPPATPPPSSAPAGDASAWADAAKDVPTTATPSTGDTSKIPDQAMPSYTAPPVVITPHQPKGIMGVVQSVADALTGTTRPEIATGSDGNKYVKETTLTHGEQWRQIGGQLLAGAAAGLAAGKGAGNMGKAAFAGVQEGEHLQDRQQQQRKDMSTEARQQNLDSASNQMTKMNLAASAWKATRDQVESTEKDIKFQQAQEDRIKEAHGQFIGTAVSHADISRVLKVNPTVMEDLASRHIIELTNHYNADGRLDGIRVFKMPTDYKAEILPPGAPFHSHNPLTNEIEKNNSSDPMTRGEQLNYDTVAQTEKNKADSLIADQKRIAAQTAQAQATASEAPSVIEKNKAEATKALAEAGKATAEKKMLNEAGDLSTIQSNAKQLVEGTADPSNLSKRSKAYDATVAAANAYSMQTLGVPFDIAKATGDYKAATNQQTVNKLNLLNSLTGRDNKSGNLQTVIDMSNKLGQTKFPPLNDVVQWAKIAAGNPAIPAYRGALLDVSEQVGNILQGGGNSTSDMKLKAASGVFDQSFNAQQMGAAAETQRTLLANRKLEIIGDNRYLQRWHGHPSQTPPADASHVFSPTAWLAKTPGGNVTAAIAAAKAQGYEVTQ